MIPRPGPRTQRIVLVASFAGLLLAIVLYGFVLPQTPARMARPTAALIDGHPLWAFVHGLPLPIPRRPWTVAALVAATVGLAFASYAAATWASWRWRGSARTARAAALGGIALAAVSVAALPNVNTDVYNYMMRGRIAAVHGSNPYYTAADQFSEDPVLRYASDQYTHDPGGKPPVWMVVNIGLASLTGDNVVKNLFVYRMGLFALAAASVLLVLWILRRIEPRHALAGTVLFGWSPVVAVYANVKTDIVMVVLLLAATAALVVDRRRRTVVFLTLSGFVKFISLPFLAVYGLREVRHRRWREVAWIAALGLGVVLLVHLPFSRDASIIFGIAGAAESAGSDALGMHRALFAGFVALVAVVGMTRQRSSVRHLLRGWAFVGLYFALFLMPFAMSWYLMTVIAVIALVREPRIVAVLVVLSFASFGINTWRTIGGAALELPSWPLPGHAAYLAPLALLVLLTAAYASRRGPLTA